MSTPFNSRAERQLAQALSVLGLRPGATGQDVDTAYFMRRTALSNQENAEAELRQMEKAIRLIKVRQRFADEKPKPAPESVSDAQRLSRSLKLLGLSPEATAKDVDAAIATARSTVTDRDRLREFQRAAYVVKTRGRTRRSRRSQRRVGRFLIITSLTLVVLTAFSGFQLATRFRHHFVRFEPGDALYRLDDGKPFGVIVSFEENHRFPNGGQRDAFQVRLYPDDVRAWISANTAHSALKTKR